MSTSGMGIGQPNDGAPAPAPPSPSEVPAGALPAEIDARQEDSARSPASIRNSGAIAFMRRLRAHTRTHAALSSAVAGCGTRT